MLSKWYQKISDLPLTRFIDCAVDGDLSALILEGQPSPADLQNAWEDIKMQYADALQDSEYKRTIYVIKEITRLDISLKEIELGIQFMMQYHDLYIIDCSINVDVSNIAKNLNILTNSSFKFDVKDSDKFMEELSRVSKRSKGLLISMELKKAELEKLQSKVVKGDFNREYFDNMLIYLSNDAGYELNETAITVYKFCLRLRNLIKKSEAIKNGPRQNR